VTVRLTQPVLGLAVGASYTGNLESWLLNEGYATTAASVPDAWVADENGVPGADKPSVTVTPTAAVLTGPDDAVNIVTTGDIIFGTEGGVRTTATLTAADTPAAAATKIDTALTGLANAAIVAGNLQVTSVATGTTAYVTVVGGTASVLDDLGVTLGQEAFGGDGRPTGASNIGAQADVPDNDPTAASNREAPYFPSTPDRNVTIANDAANLNELTFPAPVNFDVDLGGVDTEAPVVSSLEPVEGPEEGGTVVRIYGDNLEGVTGVTFGGTAGTALDVTTADELGFIEVTTPAKAPGASTVVVTDPDGADTEVGAFTYLATP